MNIAPLTPATPHPSCLERQESKNPEIRKAPLRVLVLDETPGTLIQLLRESADYVVLGVCASPSEARRAAERDLPDVVFLDARCAGEDLVQVLSGPDGGPQPSLVFVADHPGLALKAFELGASDYLLKPIRRDRFERATARVLRLREAARPAEGAPPLLARVPCVIGHGIKLIDPAEIELVRSDHCGIHLVTPRGEFLTELTLTTLEARIAPLLRCHKQYLVHVGHIDELVRSGATTATIRTCSGKVVPVSRRFLSQVKRRLLIR